LLQLLFDFFSGKAKTRLYTTFLGWLLIFHIDVLFIAIFTDQEILFKKTGLLKNEYLWSYLTHEGTLISVIFELLRFIFAALMTYLMIWVIPKHINKKSYTAELDVEYSLRKMKVAKDEELNQREEVVVKQQLENIEVEKQVVVERAKLEESPEQIRWDKDYKSFVRSNAFKFFNNIIRIVYEHGGNPRSVSWLNPGTQTLAYLDTNGIITIQQGNIFLTDKGRYFVKKFTNSPS